MEILTEYLLYTNFRRLARNHNEQ